MPKCWIHLAKEDNLRIKPSNTPDAGKGLFAWKKYFCNNQKISDLYGTKTKLEKKQTKYTPGGAEYPLCSNGKCIDANFTTDAAARFANDSRNSPLTNNSELHGRNYKYYLKANKKIKPGQEIFTSYGNNYWKYK